MSKSNEHLRKWREIQQTNNVLQRPEIYRSQKRKKPRFAARPYEYWCPDSESNQGHGDFQSPALPTELSGQRSALNRNRDRASTLFREKRFNCLTLRQCAGFCSKKLNYAYVNAPPIRHWAKRRISSARRWAVSTSAWLRFTSIRLRQPSSTSSICLATIAGSSTSRRVSSS